jgi:pimeloyl-ACP methyl ester carboxylesterase
LVHGIHSNLGGIVDLAQTLIEAGFCVVLFDVPAHGEAAGTMTDPVEVRDFLRKVCGQLVDVHAVVGHSLGALWGLSAIHDGVRAKAFVAISSPSTCRFLVDKFVQLNGLSADLAGSLVEALERRLGTGFWVEYSPKELVKQVATTGLIIHGEHDDFVPPDHAKELQSSWAGARLEMLPGAGHFDIVGLTKVRKLVAAYLQDIDASRRVDELPQSAE